MIPIKAIFKDLPKRDYNKIEFLDHILSVLYNADELKLHFKDVNREIYKENREEITNSIFIMTTDPSNELGKAFDYLTQKGLVIIKGEFIYLTYKGIVKLSFDGFKGKIIRQDKIDQFYIEYLRWTVIVAFLVLVVSLINLFKPLIFLIILISIIKILTI